MEAFETGKHKLGEVSRVKKTQKTKKAVYLVKCKSERKRLGKTLWKNGNVMCLMRIRNNVYEVCIRKMFLRNNGGVMAVSNEEYRAAFEYRDYMG